MYLVGNSFHVSFKWVVIISTTQEAAKVSTCYILWLFGDWSLITGRGGYKLQEGGGVIEVLPLQKKGGADFFLAVLKGGGHKKL